LELEFSLVDAGHVLERNLCVGFDIDFRSRFTDRHEPAEPLLAREVAKEETQKEIEKYGGNGPGQNGADEAAGRRAGNFDALGGKLIGDRRINPDGNKFGFAVRPWLLKRAFDYIRVDDDRGDFFPATSCSNWL